MIESEHEKRLREMEREAATQLLGMFLFFFVFIACFMVDLGKVISNFNSCP